MLSKGNLAKVLNQHRSGFKTRSASLAPNSTDLCFSLLDFLEVMRSTFTQWGGEEGTKKRIFALCKVVLFFFSHSFPPFVCALVGEPSLFRRSALLMTQPQTRSLKASTHSCAHAHTHTHTHTRTHAMFFPTKTTAALPTPTLSPEWADPSLTLAFPHKLKLNERDSGSRAESSCGL